MTKRLNKGSILVWLSLILALGLSTSVRGQPPPPPDSESRFEERERIRENIETLRMWKLLEALDLTSEQSMQFLPLLKEFQDAKRKFRDSRRELFRELESALQAEKTDEKKLGENLMMLEDARKIFQGDMDRFYVESKEILTVKQQAKLLLFEERFEKRLKESIEHMRGRGRRYREPGR